MSRQSTITLAWLAAGVALTPAFAQAPPAGEAGPPARETAPPAAPRRDVSDAQLGLEVQARLYQELEVSNLSALVRYGVATLDGTVRSEEDRRQAEQLALEIDGVASVVNELRVATPLTVAVADEAAAATERETANIETMVTNRLRSDAVLGSRAIRVEADEHTNTLTLRGTVSTEEEKERAGQVAVSAFPTGHVRNQLEVQQRL